MWTACVIRYVSFQSYLEWRKWRQIMCERYETVLVYEKGAFAGVMKEEFNSRFFLWKFETSGVLWRLFRGTDYLMVRRHSTCKNCPLTLYELINQPGNQQTANDQPVNLIVDTASRL
jgi:hypothetical protein